MILSPILSLAEIDIYLTRFSEIKSSNLVDFHKLLSEDELLRLDLIKSKEAKYAYIASRGLLRKIICCNFQLDNNSLDFSYSSDGKPRFSCLTSPSAESKKFNLSHSGDYFILAIGEVELGIDIQFTGGNILFYRMLHNILDKQEMSEFSKLPLHDQNKAFYRIWSRKESVLKYLGKGLSYPMPKIMASLSPNIEVDLFLINSGSTGRAITRDLDFQLKNYVSAITWYVG